MYLSSFPASLMRGPLSPTSIIHPRLRSPPSSVGLFLGSGSNWLAMTYLPFAFGKYTQVDVAGGVAQSVDQLEIAVGIDSLQSCLPFTPPNGLQTARVLLDNRDKTITLTFNKFLVNQVPNNGTPLFTICFAAPWGNWVTASGAAPTLNTATNDYVGILPDCTASNLAPQNPCVLDRSKHAANEIVTVSVPYQSGRADPKLW